jgi:hypothetical protein
MKSIWKIVTPSIGSVGRRSMPTTRAAGAFLRTTWLHPPGAMPRSTTRCDPRSRVNFSSSSISLKAARLRQPSARACLT